MYLTYYLHKKQKKATKTIKNNFTIDILKLHIQNNYFLINYFTISRHLKLNYILKIFLFICF